MTRQVDGRRSRRALQARGATPTPTPSRATVDGPVVAVALAPVPAVQAAWWATPDARHAPLAVAPLDGPVVAACPRAVATGVAPGQTLAQARLRCPRLRVLPPDGATTRALWRAALRALAGVSPVVEEADAAHGVAYVDPRGIEARAGTGPGRVAALALATRQGDQGPLALAGAEATAFLRGLPVDDPALSIDPSALRDLREVGVATGGILASLPEASLAIRFGPTVARAWHALAGDEPPLRPWAAPPSRVVARRLDGAVDDAAVVVATLGRLAGDLSARLAADGRAAATLALRLDCDDGVQHVHATYHDPSLQGASAIAARAQEMWGRLTPRAPVGEVALDAVDLVSPHAAQAGL